MDASTLNTAFRCPRCDSERFIVGPRGGIAINLKCADCGVKWWFCPPFTPIEIDNDDVSYVGPVVLLREWCETRINQGKWPTSE